MRITTLLMSAALATVVISDAYAANGGLPLPILKPLSDAKVMRAREQVASDVDTLYALYGVPGLHSVQDYHLPDAGNHPGQDGDVAGRALAVLDSLLAKLGMSWEEVRSATTVQPLPALAHSPFDQGVEADGEIRLTIDLSERVSIGPTYGLHLLDDELRRTGGDVSHHFKLGASFEF